MGLTGRLNMYTCDTCHGFIVTINRVEGTTPMELTCRATPGCHGLSESSWYRVSPALVPDHEWYRPTGDEYARLSPGMRDHVDRGGLDIRRIDTSVPSRVEP